ncbi:hypothetical protein CGLAU_09215 [Corynebacterium glaucum]|uniref:Esterase n=2 Tax=Corynebacterium glaucum TaxID=187491 RepID=A0A1Q2HY83_9CORY|nr:YqiA/YcfP family alpha/beta fold hydrolase [Corynebacterium glaucum]AQQ15794.1 hypothetical protein CGLAU_09215 [Corynebacterium glaucum]
MDGSVYLFRSIAEFEAAEVPAGISSIAYGAGTLDLLLVHRPSQNLVVIFHAAADPATVSLPIFVGQGITQNLDASVLFVSDPALDFRIPIGWYTGDEKRHLQADLARVIRHVASTVGAENIIFEGSSAGGFAALVYSHAFPGSLAMAVNPQTDIYRYHQGKVDEYLTACWGGGKPPAKETVTSAIELYRESFPNYVLYLQNQRDEFHVMNHYEPWAQRFGELSGTRWTTIEGDWGDGHAPPPPFLQEAILQYALSFEGHWDRLIREGDFD